MTVNSGDKQVLVNLDCSIQHFLNFVESKSDSLGRASQNEDGATSPGDHLGEDVDSFRVFKRQALIEFSRKPSIISIFDAQPFNPCGRICSEFAVSFLCTF